MNMVMNLVLALQILTALVMIGLVLIQHGKGADMGASFGSGASGSLFGATGSANFLSRSTAVCAASSSSARSPRLQRERPAQGDDRQRPRPSGGERAGAAPATGRPDPGRRRRSPASRSGSAGRARAAADRGVGASRALSAQSGRGCDSARR